MEEDIKGNTINEDHINPEVDDDDNQDDQKAQNMNKLEVDNRNVRQFEDNTEDNDLRQNQREKFKVPSSLKKTFWTTMALFVTGSLLLGLGFIEEIKSDVPGLAISMWVLGGITFIPGGYYAYLFYKACKAPSGEERDEILDQIPEL